MTDESNQKDTPTTEPVARPESTVALESVDNVTTPEHKTHTLSLVLLAVLAALVVGAYWYSNTYGVEPAVQESVVQEEAATDVEDSEYTEMMRVMEEIEARTDEEGEGGGGDISTEEMMDLMGTGDSSSSTDEGVDAETAEMEAAMAAISARSNDEPTDDASSESNVAADSTLNTNAGAEVDPGDEPIE